MCRFDILSAIAAAALAGVVLMMFSDQRYLAPAVPAVAFTVYALARPRTATLALIPLGMLISVAFEWGLAREVNISQVTVAIVSGGICVVGVGVAVHWMSGRLQPNTEHLIVAGLAALVLVSYLAPPVAASPLAGDRHFPGLLVCLLMLAIAAVVAPKPAHVLQLLVWCSVAVALFAFSRGLYGGNGRLYTEVYYSTWLGIIEGPALVACAGLAYVRRTWFWLAPGLVCLACVLAAGARSGMLAALVGVTFVLMAGRQGLWRYLLPVVLAAGAVLALTAGSSADDLLAPMREGSSIASSDMHRTGLMLSSLDMIAQHPLRGVGYGNLVGMIDVVYGARTGAHNDYIRLAAENGLPALALFLLLVVRGVRPRQEGDAAVVRAVVVSCLVWIGTDVALPHPVISVSFWIPLGCLLAMRAAR